MGELNDRQINKQVGRQAGRRASKQTTNKQTNKWTLKRVNVRLALVAPSRVPLEIAVGGNQ